MNLLYGLCLAVSISGLAVLDRKYQLALWHDRRRALLTISIMVGVFIIWDMIGIAYGIFMMGESPYYSGWQLAPQFPPEEIGFLILLVYTSLILHTGVQKYALRSR